MFPFCLFAAADWFDSAEGASVALAELAAERPAGNLVGNMVGNVVGNAVGNVVGNAVGKGKLVESCLIEAFSSLLSICFLTLFR